RRSRNQSTRFGDRGGAPRALGCVLLGACCFFRVERTVEPSVNRSFVKMLHVYLAYPACLSPAASTRALRPDAVARGPTSSPRILPTAPPPPPSPDTPTLPPPPPAPSARPHRPPTAPPP